MASPYYMLNIVGIFHQDVVVSRPKNGILSQPLNDPAPGQYSRQPSCGRSLDLPDFGESPPAGRLAEGPLRRALMQIEKLFRVRSVTDLTPLSLSPFRGEGEAPDGSPPRFGEGPGERGSKLMMRFLPPRSNGVEGI